MLTLEDGDKSIPSLLPHPSGLSSQVSSSKRPPEIWEYHITALLPWLRLLLMPRHVTTAIVASSITCVLFHGPAPHGSSCADGLFSQIWATKGPIKVSGRPWGNLLYAPLVWLAASGPIGEPTLFLCWLSAEDHP